MSTHKHVDLICLALCLGILAAVAGLLLWKYPKTQSAMAAAEPDYASGLFDTSAVHTIDITMEDWDGFLETCENEDYAMCAVTIDGERVSDIGIRAKGNTSLSSVKQYGNDRYSFKLEFDHYQEGGNFQGLDKLSLNNIIQDNTYMKDYIVYRMMDLFGVDAPLCSYAWLTVNGEDWGLYLAVESVEESFLERNYGGGQGELYKPDTMNMGGGKGAGGDFKMPENFDPAKMEPPQGMEAPENFDPATMTPPGDGEPPEGFDPTAGEGAERGKGGFSMGSDDVRLIYTDDEFDSYANIFNNAKTESTDADKTRLISSLKTLNEGSDIESVVDVEEVLRYFAVHNFVCNFDSYTGSMIHNYYLYEEDGVLSMIPWDYNLAFGGFMSTEDATEVGNYPIDEPVSGGSVEDRPMLDWIFADEAYTQQYHTYVADFLAQFFSDGWMESEIDRVTEMIAPYVEKDPTKFCTYEEFETGTAALKTFCQLRAESILGQLSGTIPADSQGQQADSAALIDASGLNLSDMGSMGFGMGGGRPDGGQPPGFPAGNSGGKSPRNPQTGIDKGPGIE
ncbi:MAG: CotH kinase family protein [Bacillota bacterium]|nr:CotH kinase family protein [Bacillota bacterium]